MKNRISEKIDSKVLDLVFDRISDIEEALPFLINLPDDERLGGFRLGDKNLGFLTKSKDYMNQKPEFMPTYVAVDEVSKDTELAVQLATIQRKLAVLTGKLEDTANIAGMEALTGALAYYNSVKEAARNNADGASTIYSDLKKRFPGVRKSKEV